MHLTLRNAEHLALNATAQSAGQDTRLDSVDGLRGLAACAVAFVYHYQHFGFAPPYKAGFLSTPLLQWLETYGWLGVDLFFLLSGFIFARNYSAEISAGQVDGSTFAQRRFSRLYPLHILTMIAAGVISWGCWLRLGFFPLYGDNDLFHLVLNVTFLQGLGLSQGVGADGFNAPTWSLAYEAACYILFFYVCKIGQENRFVLYVILLLLGLVLLKLNPAQQPVINQPMGRALTGFFAGCIVAEASKIQVLRWFALAIMCFGLANAYMVGGVMGVAGASFYQTFDLAIFPILLTCVVMFLPLRTFFGAPPLAYLGRISYAIYLLHAVTQEAIIFGFRWAGIRIPFEQPAFFAGYVATVLVLSSACYYAWEMPAQRWLRYKFATADARAEVAQPRIQVSHLSSRRS